MFIIIIFLGTLERSKRSTVIVISPLISLMTDQVQSLRSRGVSAAIMSSSFNEKIDKILVAKHCDLIVPGKFSLLFAAPEAIIGVQGWREMMLSPPLCDQLVAIAVDEAHCVSKW